MKHLLLASTAAIGALASAAAPSAGPLAGARPNIVFILSDDQGYGDFSAHGNPVLRTPRLDRLRAESVRFADFQVSPTCAPTRAALLTGRHEFRNGVTHTIFERERLAPGATTLADVLKSAGYTTGIFGKWHLGDEPAYQPERRGFDEVFIHGGGGIGQTYPGSCGDAPGNTYFSPTILHNGRFEKTDGFCTDVFFSQAVRWIESVRDRGQPFFVYLPTNAPHLPYTARPEDAALYRDRVADERVANFFGMIHNLDENVSRLLARLDALGLAENTLVVYMTDNGGTAGTKVFNAGMRGAKTSPWYGGTRAAAFWHWPGRLVPHDVGATAAHLDFLPTIAEIAGANLDAKTRAQVEGCSLVPLLERADAPWPDRTLFTHVGRWRKGADPAAAKYQGAAVREGRWHLVSPGNRPAPPWQLYDLQADLAEQHDVASAHPDVVNRLAAAYEAWWDSVQPQLVNEQATGPRINPFKERYWQQFGGGPTEEDLRRMDPSSDPLSAPPPRLRRADSFFGIHFDFHARADDTGIGRNTTPAMIGRLIDLVHPDYLQIDCKGHPGWSSYPTKVGQPVPGIVGDPLRIWRDVTARRGVALYLHYSGVIDAAATSRTGWAAITANGAPAPRATSLFGPYPDQLLIPQLRELAGLYGVDGVWLDGECWGVVPDYSEPALRAFRASTGFPDVPRRRGDPHWFEFLQFHRQAFRDYLQHYVTEVKRTHPSLQLCSNWAFSHQMPEPVSVPLDFLSGDYSPDNSVNSARFAGRYLAQQGRPWDLMAWSFSRQASSESRRAQKPAAQLQREAAVVLALGGGFQAYFKQKRDGSVHDEELPVMAALAAFCRERQAVCHRAVAVPQVALLFSTAAHYRTLDRPFGRSRESPLPGVLQALLESQQSVEVLGEHHFAGGRMKDYPLIVVPETDHLEPAFRDELAAYVRAGGQLLLVGPRAAALFQDELDVRLPGVPEPDGPVFLTHNGAESATSGETQTVTLGARAVAHGWLHTASDPAPRPAASVASLGRGRIAATYFTFGRAYLKDQGEAPRRFLHALVRELFPRPVVEVAGSADVDVCVARNHDRLLVNLVNTAGPHRSAPIMESIPPVGPLTVTVRLAARPARITLAPSDRDLAFVYHDGKITFTVPSVPIHEIVVIEP